MRLCETIKVGDSVEVFVAGAAKAVDGEVTALGEHVGHALVEFKAGDGLLDEAEVPVYHGEPGDMDPCECLESHGVNIAPDPSAGRVRALAMVAE